MDRFSYRVTNKGFMDGFVGNMIILMIGGGILLWAIMRFGVTYDVSTVKQKMSKLDGSAVMISGRVTDMRPGFTEIPTGTGSPYMGFKLKTRKGEAWVVSLKDKPAIGTKLFMEVEVIGSIDTANKRFNILPSQKLTTGSPLYNMLPVFLEKSRIGLPFIF